MPTIITETFARVSKGVTRRQGVVETFSTIRAGSGTSSFNTADYVRMTSTTTTDRYSELTRSMDNFDTSSIPDDAVITEARLDFPAASFLTTGLGNTDLCFVSASPTTIGSLVNSDYSNFGTTIYGSIPLSSISTTDDNVVYLNPDGLSYISKTGITCLGMRLRWDVENSFTGTWVSGFTTDTTFQGGGTDSEYLLSVSYYIPRDPETAPHSPITDYNGTEFQRSKTKIWDGSVWVYSKPRMYDGTGWRDLL